MAQPTNSPNPEQQKYKMVFLISLIVVILIVLAMVVYLFIAKDTVKQEDLIMGKYEPDEYEQLVREREAKVDAIIEAGSSLTREEIMLYMPEPGIEPVPPLTPEERELYMPEPGIEPVPPLTPEERELYMPEPKN